MRKSVARYWQILVLVAVGASSNGAHAQSLTATKILQEFNAVIFGNYDSNATVDGRAVIGGTMSAGGTFHSSPGSEASSTLAALSVYGSVTDTNTISVANGGGLTVAGLNSSAVNLSGGGSVYIGGANSGNISNSGAAVTIGINGNNTATIQTGSSGGSVSINGKGGWINGGSTSNTNVYLPNSSDNNETIQGATIHYGTVSLTNPLPSFSATFETPLTNLSTQLEGLTANSTTSTAGQTVTFNAAPNAAGQAIFDISSSLLTAGNEHVVFDANGATTIIVNVTCGGANCTISLPSSDTFESDTTYAAETLWNFYDASTLDFGSEFGGTVLAPNAAVANSSPIDGDLIANSFTGSAELHNYPFTGNLTFAVPEPASLWLLGVGVAGLIAARPRSRKLQVRPRRGDRAI
jgi:choice-of-anchor A domain-containing protein